MALSTAHANNKTIKFRADALREFIRENEFSPYMGADPTAIFRLYNELKSGGEQLNIPLVSRAQNTGKGSGTLTGNEEDMDNYGFRVWIDWARNAIKTKKNEQHKSSIDLWALHRPLLMDWGKEKQSFEIVDALYALPSESAPVGLGSDDGQRVNGILFDAATAAQRNTWITNNVDRVLIGNSNTSNLVAGNFASSMANVTTAMTLSAALINRMKRSAKNANPRIKPYRLEDGREMFVLFVGQEQFRDLQNDTTMINANTLARAREGTAMNKNPLFVDGDLLYNNVLIREIPNLSSRLPAFYATAGNGAAQIAPAFLCGQSALAFAWGQLPIQTEADQTDYNFLRGNGIEMAYGIAKIAKKNAAGLLKEWAVYTGFFAAVADA